MGTLLSYSIISGIVLLALCLAYRLFMARYNQHSFNRAILLSIYAISFLSVPVFNEIHKILTVTSHSALPGDIFATVKSMETVSEQPIWSSIAIWIYLMGITVIIARNVVTWIRLTKMICSGEKHNGEGYTIVVTDDKTMAPFSWLHYIVMNRDDYDSNSAAILTHELKHVTSNHWVDLIIAQCVCIINWFNPAAWFMRDELMLIHEYQADLAVLENGHDLREYQILLIKKAVGARFPSLTNSLNHSKLKKRITMMYKEKSCAGRKYKALVLVPMLALAFGVSTMPAVSAAVSTISSCNASVGKDKEKKPQHQDKGVSMVDKLVDLPDGVEIYYDGKKINKSQFKNLDADKIESMIVDKEFNRIVIHSKGLDADKIESMIVDKQVNRIIIHSDNKTAKDDEMEIYLDSNKVEMSEIHSMNPEAIASVIVDKENNRIIVASK